MTVVFADISGSTTLYAERGDASAFHLASTCLGVVERNVAAAGGRVVKRLGDGVMALFAKPDDALRAARAARAALAGTDDVQQPSVHVRFGISCGEALLAADDVFGDVVNIAARLVGIAGPDEIFLSGSACTALVPSLRDQARWIDHLVLRNRPAPVPVYKFVGDELDATVGAIPHATPRTAVLEITRGNTCFVLTPERPRLSIGRYGSHDICIEHEAVSRSHAEVNLRGDKFVITDRSINGTYVYIDGAPVLRVLREELTLSGSGRIVPGIEYGAPIRFRVTGR